MADVDDGTIENDHNILRRIRPDQVVLDQNLGIRRPSSAAFKDPELSADSEHILGKLGLDWQFSLRGCPGYSLARLKAGVPRGLGLPVLLKPIDGNDAHVEVHGKKTQGTANSLVVACSWAHLET